MAERGRDTKNQDGPRQGGPRKGVAPPEARAGSVSQDVTDAINDAADVSAIATDVQSIEKVVPNVISGFINIFNGHDRAFRLSTAIHPAVELPAHSVTPVPIGMWRRWQAEMGASPLKEKIVESR